MSASTGEVHVQLLLGRRIVDRAGRDVGRIGEMCAEERDGEWVVTEYHTGVLGTLERFAAVAVGKWILRLFRRSKTGYRIRWDQMDLSEPERPRVRCRKEELEELA